jgi:hypothetical protein
MTTGIPFRLSLGIGFVWRIVVFKIVVPGFGGEQNGRKARSAYIQARIGGFAQFQKHGEGAVVLAVIGGFGAVLEAEDAGVIGQAAKSDGGEDGSRSGGRVLAGHLLLKAGGLNSPDAQQTPAGDGHGLDQEYFGGIAGLKLAAEGCGEVVKTAHGFALEDDGAGDEAVTVRVL